MKQSPPASITDLKNSDKPYYSLLFSKSQLVEDLCKTKDTIFKTWVANKKSFSPNSFSFGDSHSQAKSCITNKAEREDAAFRLLMNIFSLKTQADRLKEFFHQAVSGLELARITRLHSSSLVAFLCFGTCDEIPLTIDGIKRNFKLRQFEWENNNAIKDVRPHIDICLECRESGKQCLLLLESKFSEYLAVSKRSSDYISPETYLNTYKTIFTKQLHPLGYISNIKREKKDSLAIISDSKHYLNGIKQIICHWMGAKGSDYHGKIYLGEILFRFPPLDDSAFDPYEDYQHLYKSVRARLSELDQEISLLPTILSYQDVFKNIELPNAVKSFYAL